MYAIVCVGLSLIETSLCAQALWVDVSGALGRSPPSSYPSRERSAAKPNLGFTAFDKPSNGAPGQRAKKRQGRRRQRRKPRKRAHTHVRPRARMSASERESVRLKISHRDGISGWSYCAFCLAVAAGFKTRIRSIHGFLCVNVRGSKKKKSASLPPCQYFTSCFLTHSGFLPTRVDFFSLPFVAVITRHKCSVCHSGLCSERPLSAYLRRM